MVFGFLPDQSVVNEGDDNLLPLIGNSHAETLKNWYNPFLMSKYNTTKCLDDRATDTRSEALLYSRTDSSALS